MEKKPLVGISTNEIVNFNGRQISHSTGQRYVNAVMRFSTVIPILIPSFLSKYDIETLINKLDGVVLTGGRANIEPKHYDGKKFPPDEPIDPGRDNVVLEIIPKCIEMGVPIFGICRGIQEINVALGGTIYYRVHQVEGMKDHRMPRGDDVTIKEIFALRHNINFTEDNSYFKKLTGKDRFKVNSLHGQGINKLGNNLKIEALSEDNLIEAISIESHPSFGIAVQWHAEFEPEKQENYLNKKLFEEFGKACRNFCDKKSNSIRS